MSDPMFSGAPGKAPEPAPPPADAPTFLLGHSQDDSENRPRMIQLWMHRISVFLFVLVSAVAGVLLIILPWTPEWTDNYLLLSFPALRSIISNGFFRGICSGLGLLDIWIGFWEALHYHEHQ
jgi:hypothetical protein